MVAACHFDEGAVIIADSRVTWMQPNGRGLYGDTAQKILPLGSNLALAFSGPVPLANRIVREIRTSIKKKPRLSNPLRLSHKLSRSVSYYYRECLRNSEKNKCSVSFILGGLLSQGRPLLWTYQPPDFLPTIVSEWVVIGSGSPVRSYFENNFHHICKKKNSLKDKATILISGLESELSKHNIITVGGLFQAILLSSGKIYPLTYGFIDLTPEDPGRAMETTIHKGTWTQKDLTKQKQVSLVEPRILSNSPPKENRFLDYDPPTEKQKSFRWYLNYFFTSLKVEKQVNGSTYKGVVSQIGTYHYPMAVSVLTSLAFWGAHGTYPLKFCMDKPSGKILLHQENVCIEYLYEGVEIERMVRLEVDKPGPIFLECYIGSFLLGRKALYFGKLENEISPKTKEWLDSRKHINENLVSAHRKCSDPALGQSVCFLDYFIICQNAVLSDCEYKFIGEMMAVYSKKYPLFLQICIASGFRFSKGKHGSRIDLVNAFTHEVNTVTSGTFEAISECNVVHVQGRLSVKISEPGIYYFNLYVDEQFITSFLLPAETENTKYSFSLLDEDLNRIRSGEVMILSKQSKQAID